MSRIPWDEIQALVEASRPADSPVRDTDRIKKTAEVFTPTDLVIDLIKRVPERSLLPGVPVLDPACGDGQFLVAVKWVKVLGFHATEQEALDDIYGIDIMADNVRICRARLGGGNIAVGDALHPQRNLPSQTASDKALLKLILSMSPVEQESLFAVSPT